MKKLLLAAALMLTSFGAFADEFDDFVKKMQAGVNKKGIELVVFKRERVILLNGKFPMKFSELNEQQLRLFSNIDEFKRMTVEEFRKHPVFMNMVRKYHTTLVYNFIFADFKVASMVITPDDLR